MKIKTFRELEAWKHARDLALFVYDVTDRFPKEEKYGITSQIRRAAVSVGANIAQGFGRATTLEFLNSLRIARGELEETRHFLIFAAERKYLTTEDREKGESLCDSTGRLINALGTSLKSRLERVKRQR